MNVIVRQYIWSVVRGLYNVLCESELSMRGLATKLVVFTNNVTMSVP